MSVKRNFIVIHILVVAFFLGFIYIKFIVKGKEPAPVAVDLRTLQQADNESASVSSPKPLKTQEVSFPKELNLKVQFFAQAPEGNWDYPWQEACEEASILLIDNAIMDKNWSRDDFKNEILKLVEWENKMFGDYKHTDLEQNERIISEYLGLKYSVVKNPSFEDVKKALNKGHLVLMTFAGKALHNPNYKNGGPNYHAMVIKGYEDNKIVTNDVGTRKGEDYVYSWDTINSALHDWAEPIENGNKVMLEIYK